jgi:hypothetical protein
MTPDRLVEKLIEGCGVTFNVAVDDDGGEKVKVTKIVGDYRYTVRYNQEDDTKVLLIIKHRELVNEHRSRQNTKKSLAMVLAHIASPTPAFKLLYRVQEAGD